MLTFNLLVLTLGPFSLGSLSNMELPPLSNFLFIKCSVSTKILRAPTVSDELLFS